MLKVIGLIIVPLAMGASILGLYFCLFPPGVDRPFWHWIGVVLVVCISLALAGREVLLHVKYAPKTYRKEEEINAYMRRWVSSAGRIVILSRDMSWVVDPETRKALQEKATANDLTICLDRSIPLTNDLRNRGARIIEYHALGHVPRSRFTIVGFGIEGSRVAIGVKDGDDHVIQEYRSGSHPCFAVAEDLVRFLGVQ